MPPPDQLVRPGFLGGFALATALLTRIPVATGPAESGMIAASAWAFPLVGIGVGAIAAFAFLAAQLLALGDLPSSLLAVLAAILLTGALHEDGLADTMDGLGGADPAARLAIMRDSRQGTYGVLALILSVGLRAAAIAAIADVVHAGLALVAAHAVSRAGMAAAMRALPLARPDGMGNFAGRTSLATTAMAAVIGGGIALAALGPPRGVLALAVAAMAMAAMAALARRRLGGYTGDVLGAVQQVGEIAMLLVAAAK